MKKILLRLSTGNLVVASDHADAIRLAGVDPIASVEMGSALYNTQITHHDVDIALFVPKGRSMQFMEGDLDVRVIPLDSILAPGTKGFLYETDAMLGLLYGHGIIYESHPWSYALRSFRPSIWKYADTVRRFKLKNPGAIKHIARYEIFLERFWLTGIADPKLSDNERLKWRRTTGL